MAVAPIVLGHFPAYIDLAKSLSARVFSIPSEVYQSMTPEQRWDANQAFIDSALADGCPIILATPPSQVRVASAFQQELAYLTDLGWTPVWQNGRWELRR